MAEITSYSFRLENGKAFEARFFSLGKHVGKLYAVTRKVTKLPDICVEIKLSHIADEQVVIHLVSFMSVLLLFLRFDILRMVWRTKQLFSRILNKGIQYLLADFK